MLDKFLILDNVISKTYLTELVDNIFDYNWKFTSNLTFGDEKPLVSSISLEHGFNALLSNEQILFILPLIYTICDLSNIEVEDKKKIYITPRLQTMLSPNNQINDVHLDCKKNHYVIIFYPHTIDGETILYNETTSEYSHSNFYGMSYQERKKLIQNFTILKKVKPKENRALIFDGGRYHASSSPSLGPRCILNINVHYNISNNKDKNLKVLKYL